MKSAFAKNERSDLSQQDRNDFRRLTKLLVEAFKKKRYLVVAAGAGDVIAGQITSNKTGIATLTFASIGSKKITRNLNAGNINLSQD